MTAIRTFEARIIKFARFFTRSMIGSALRCQSMQARVNEFH